MLSLSVKQQADTMRSKTEAHRPTLAQDQAMFSVLWFIRGWSLLSARTKSIVHSELFWASCVDFLTVYSLPPLEASVAAIPFLWVKTRPVILK